MEAWLGVKTGLSSIAGTEAVRPVPAPVRCAQGRDVHARVEPGELPGPARERRLSGARRKIEVDVPERLVVAGARRIEHDVRVQDGGSQGTEGDDLRADREGREVRGRRRAGVTFAAPA